MFGFLSKKIKNKVMCFVCSYFVASFIASFFIISICTDGWTSSSIGSQGACSYHGGVKTTLDATGLLIFVLCSIALVAKGINNGAMRTKTPEYRTKEQEQIIKDYCCTQGIPLKINHEIHDSVIVASFKFDIEEDFNKIIVLNDSIST